VLKQQHQLFVGLIVAADAAVITVACFGAWLFRRAVISHAWWPQAWENYPKDALVLYTVPITLLALRAFGLYLPRRDRTLINELAQVVKACALAMLGVLAILYVFDSSIFELTRTQPELTWTFGRHTVDAGRVQLAALGLFLPLALSLHRLVSRALLRSVRRRGWNLRHVCIIGSGRLGQIVARTLERNPWTGIKVSYFVSHVDHPRHDRLMDKPVRGGLCHLESLLTEHKPDAVYVALPARQAALLPDVLARLEKFPVDVRIVPDVSPRYVPQSMTVNELDGMPILSYRESPTTGLGGISKRALDIAGAIAALIIFSPIMLLVAIFVRISGPGPLIFKQRRVSLGGQIFDIYKFRTMHHAGDEASSLGARPSKRSSKHAAGAHPEWTTPDDPRVTGIGRFLRKTSLDELPQLFNVLVGEMSLVGPRPERPELIERFKEDWRGYMMRQHVKAGMTGWAQINGHRGNSSLRKRLQYDLFYVKNWSIAFDLKILWLTLFRGFVHKNAH
jgi:exopolysaccharide biosynthesis polyprenyl glycosylphosphotransferase